MNIPPIISNQPLEFPIWADGDIDLSGWTQPEEQTHLANGLLVARNVSRPTLTAYLPDPAAATGAAVVVAPGGAYHFLAIDHEGEKVARWLNAHGIAAFMLKYRLQQTYADLEKDTGAAFNTPGRMDEILVSLAPLFTADGCQAVRTVRAHAAEWRIDPHKIGIMGFSAGGHVTLNVARLYDESSRPDFAAPIYSAPPLPAPVPADAPPLFLLCAADDSMASAVSTEFYGKWRESKHPVELHIYAQGGHGFGMLTLGLPCDHWIERFHEWLLAQQLG